ncbi:hypothetical protein FO442_13355 [Fluviicola chungangensis]|uniref:Lmo0937 family membrane protein n=1 Tax=Fluviicola chungangensis TaxID=2597671 RepID=A0A556MQ98_9FLAO|nr:hypothetical protein FO442_13355 [Fluviicola chungangensis]
MRIIICILALIVITGWAIVYFKFNKGGMFHLTLAVAVIAIATQLLPGSRTSDKLKDQNHERRKRSLSKR